MKRNQINAVLAIGLVLIAATMRIVNMEMQLWNLAPIAAIGIFSSAVLKDKRLSYLLPLLSMLISDLYMQFFTNMPGFYGISQWFVYGGMALVTLMGTFMGKINAVKVVGFTLSGTLIFFILSNLGVYFGGYYGQGVEAFTTTFAQAIPFLKNSVQGDMIGGLLLFGGYFAAQRALSPKMLEA